MGSHTDGTDTKSDLSGISGNEGNSIIIAYSKPNKQ
jgi:hypothetical protein